MSNALISQELIERKIYIIRGQKVMLDRDLADLYGVPTGRLNEQVRRNIKKFPHDFMFRLTDKEAKSLISHFAISKRGGTRHLPYAFTEQGVAMLSSVLTSDRAIDVNIAIMRAFVRFRRMISAHKELAQKLAELEKKIEKHDVEIIAIFEAIRQLMEPMPKKERSKIGFHAK
ncbi:MAG: ORF6N domain-containing protein [Candidatus Omnitrophota bacterium]